MLNRPFTIKQEKNDGNQAARISKTIDVIVL